MSFDSLSNNNDPKGTFSRKKDEEIKKNFEATLASTESKNNTVALSSSIKVMNRQREKTQAILHFFTIRRTNGKVQQNSQRKRLQRTIRYTWLNLEKAVIVKQLQLLQPFFPNERSIIMKNQNNRYNVNDITRETFYQLPKVFFLSTQNI